jgi:hypothetical protein
MKNSFVESRTATDDNLMSHTGPLTPAKDEREEQIVAPQ